MRRSRYLAKNSGFVREMVNNMAIYSTGDGIRPQAQSDDVTWNRQAEAYFRAWSTRCEITGRFSFEEVQSLVCRGMDVDGEYFIHLTRSRLGIASLQLIESHRIGEGNTAMQSFHGITLDAWGAPISYRVLEDQSARELPAQSVLHVFEPEQATSPMSVSGVVAGWRRMPLKVTGRLMESVRSKLPVKVPVVGMKVSVFHLARFVEGVSTLTAFAVLIASGAGGSMRGSGRYEQRGANRQQNG